MLVDLRHIFTIASPIQKSSHPGLRINLRRVNNRRKTVIKAREVNTQVTTSTVGPRFWSPRGGMGRGVDCSMVRQLDGKKKDV